MGEQIIKQPDGYYAVFSSITDTITVYDATDEEIVEWYAERAAEDARQRVRRQLSFVAAGNPRAVYYQFAMTWEEALETDRVHGGEVASQWSPSPAHSGACPPTPST